MTNQETSSISAIQLQLPHVPALIVQGQQALCLTLEGEILKTSLDQARHIYQTQTPLICHAPSIAARLNCGDAPCYDLLELFAYTHPAKFVIPTIAGINKFYGEPKFKTQEDALLSLHDITVHLLKDLQKQAGQIHDSIIKMPHWRWTPFITHALGVDIETAKTHKGFKVWKDLPEWSEHAPEPPTGHLPISADEASTNLKEILTRMNSTKRDAQDRYARTTSNAFHPREDQGKPNIVMAEAGTGTGKTLGYIAPAQKWAQKNEGQVWLSTYTKNLQKQIGQELNKAYPDDVEKRRKTVVRKGRENYLCLLNFEELAKRASLPTSSEQAQLMAGILARWIETTHSGDLKGGDLPGWIKDLFGASRLNALSDQRGECIHAACPHFDKCFIEKNIRQSRHAEIVIANHALVMIQNALAGEFMEDLRYAPTRYVFDEAHHLFHAADNAFAAHLSGREGFELRRWVLGQEQATQTYKMARARGLQARLDEFIKDDRNAFDYCQSIIFAARDLPSVGWLNRIHANNPQGAVEEFLNQIRQHVIALHENQNNFYSVEATKTALSDTLIQSAKKLKMHLNAMLQASLKLHQHLEKRLNEESEALETVEKQKMEALSKSIKKRLINSLDAWLSMLNLIETETPDHVLDWFVIERIEGHDFDYGFYRHWIDPMKPFIKSLENQTHGLVFTSATLTQDYYRDDVTQEALEQKKAEETLGIPYFEKQVTPHWLSLPSPFDFEKQARVIIINDLNTQDNARVADAYKALFKASKGGALGLFTSIQKLKTVYTQLLPKLNDTKIPLYAQHIDGMDISTLIDIFKEETNSCLLGTDAIRDGVDIPGQSLRMLIFDKVPWPRPDMLHKARRAHFGAKTYDDHITQMKIKQAFGRLIRTQDDKGVFVMLESRLPSRLLTAFPENCVIERVPLKEGLEIIKDFL